MTVAREAVYWIGRLDDTPKAEGATMGGESDD